MLILMLASAMTIAMLIATAFSLHAEAEKEKLSTLKVTAKGFTFR